MDPACRESFHGTGTDLCDHPGKIQEPSSFLPGRSDPPTQESQIWLHGPRKSAEKPRNKGLPGEDGGGHRIEQ